MDTQMDATAWDVYKIGRKFADGEATWEQVLAKADGAIYLHGGAKTHQYDDRQYDIESSLTRLFPLEDLENVTEEMIVELESLGVFRERKWF